MASRLCSRTSLQPPRRAGALWAAFFATFAVLALAGGISLAIMARRAFSLLGGLVLAAAGAIIPVKRKEER